MQAQRLTLGALLIAATLAIWVLATPPRSTAADQNVSIINSTFSPDPVTVDVGDTVTWTNEDGFSHTTTSDTAGIWDSGNLATSATFQHTFTQAGTFPYHCQIHPGMQGTIVVQAPGATSTSTATPSPTGSPTPSPSPTHTPTAGPSPTPTQTATTQATSVSYMPLIQQPLPATPTATR